MRTYSACVPSIVFPRIQPPVRQWDGMPPSAEVADAAGGDAGDEHEISWVKGGHARADCLDHAHTLVSENAARGDAGNVAFQDMQVGAANGRFGDANDGVAPLTNRRLGFALPRSLTRAAVNQPFHDAV